MSGHEHHLAPVPSGSLLKPRMKVGGEFKTVALFLVFISASASFAAPAPVVVDGTRASWLVGQHLFVLEDASQALTIEDVSRAEFAHRFICSPLDQPTYGFSRSAYWLRFSYLQKDSVPERRWLLAVRNASLEHVDFYFQRPDGSFDVRLSGSRVPLAKREVAHRAHVVHLPEASTAPVTVYIRVQSSHILRFPVMILTGDALIQSYTSHLVPWWIYVGVLASMALFNTVLYFFLKDRAYLYYILYIVSFGLFIGLAFKQMGYVYFPDGGPWLERLGSASVLAAFFFVALFARSFLHTPRTAPRLDRLVLVLGALSGLFALLAVFISGRISNVVGNTLGLVFGLLMLVLPIIVWRRGFQPARFFLAGWSTLCVSGVLIPLANQGLVPFNKLIEHSVMIGSTMEMILFSLALASRINEAKKESEAARRQALEGELYRLRNIELRQANEEILRKQEQLVQAEKMASLGKLTAGVAHELKNPLNFINNFSLSLVEMTDELLQEAKGLPADKQDVLMVLASDCRLAAQKIAEHGGRADGIVRGMLEHATVQPGERRMTDINRLIEEHIELVLRGTWGQRLGSHVSVERVLEPGLPPINVIPQELGRVLLNLLNNALYAVGEQHKKGLGGYIPTVRISTHGKDRHVEIRIQDNGIGIPTAVRERVFEPFFTTKPPGEGVGLGLSLSHHIITKRHAGTLGLDSTVNQGAAFVLTLPTQLA
jgi:signal transduction histidine kinase